MLPPSPTDSTSVLYSLHPTVKPKKRYSLFPIKDHEMYSLATKAQEMFWPASEIDFSKDRESWRTLDKPTQTFILHILAFFSEADGIVNQNITERFCGEFAEITDYALEIEHYYDFQRAHEAVHREVYARNIDILVESEDEKHKLFNAAQNYPCVALKLQWASHWMTSDAPLPVRLAAFSMVEGVFFKGAFMVLNWIKSRNLLPGTSQGNDFISRDESLHTVAACVLFERFRGKDRPPQELIHNMMRECVQIEASFFAAALPERLPGMNLEMMNTYIRHVADIHLAMLGYEPIYGDADPFPGLTQRFDVISRANYFEVKETNYRRGNPDQEVATFDADF